MSEEKKKFSFMRLLFPNKNKDGEKDEQNSSSSKFNKKIALCVAGILCFVVIGIFISSFSSSKKTESASSSQEITVTGQDYVLYMEERLSKIINSIKGISNAKVFLNVDSSPKITYAEDKTETENNGNKTVTTSIVFNKDGTVTTPVVVVTTYPEIVGLLIVANGAGDVKTQLMLSDTISAVLGIPSSRIQILEGR